VAGSRCCRRYGRSRRQRCPGWDGDGHDERPESEHHVRRRGGGIPLDGRVRHGMLPGLVALATIMGRMLLIVGAVALIRRRR
jgi:hypothetical protein